MVDRFGKGFKADPFARVIDQKPDDAAAKPQGDGSKADDGQTPAAAAPGSEWRGIVGGPFRNVLPRPVRPAYSVRDQFVDLARIPQRPRKVFNWRHVLALVKRTTDFFGHRRTWWGAFLSRANPYPKPFRRVEIPSFDGTLISGWLGLQSSRRPGVVIVPGMFSSKDDTAHKRKAIRMWRRWNHNVLIIDLRGFGQSQGNPNTAGWKEAEDVLAASRYLYQFNTVTKVAVVGDSLGATACLLAAAQEGLWERRARGEEPAGDQAESLAWELPGAEPLLGDPTGRTVPVRPFVRPVRLPVRVISAVVAVSPFADPEKAVDHINTLPARRDPFFFVQRLFIRLLALHTAGAHRDFRGFMKASAEHYGVTIEQLFERSDVQRVATEIRAPTLVLHAEDDDTVPVAHARLLDARVADRENIQVWVLPWGRHAEFDLLDNRWYWRVLARFLGQWVGN